jgi:secreted trypsin-like serine protease
MSQSTTTTTIITIRQSLFFPEVVLGSPDAAQAQSQKPERIVNGKPAARGQFPFQVAVRIPFRF